ncbi:DUF4267 domain-containing protein [Micromonospora sp. U21]|uniref:DUF4267 domain-containing protein n=1 Tax=Micromonospora sp. U21 TaxID=2824899 RepID=UPI0035A8502B
MLTNVANVLAGLIGAGIIFMGARAFWAPQAAAGFGIPGTPTEDRNFQAWLSVKAVRGHRLGALHPHPAGWSDTPPAGLVHAGRHRHTRRRRTDRAAQ